MDRSCRAAAEVSSEPGKHLGSISEPSKSVQLVYQCLCKLPSHLQEPIRHYEIGVFHAVQSWRGSSQVLLSLDSLFVSLHKGKEWSIFHPISPITVHFCARRKLHSGDFFCKTDVTECLQVPANMTVFTEWTRASARSGIYIRDGRRRLDPEVIENNWHMSKKNVERGTEHPQYVHIHWSFFFCLWCLPVFKAF